MTEKLVSSKRVIEKFMKIVFAWCSLILVTFSLNLSAQISDPQFIPNDRTLISVPVTVSDREGRYIPDLKKEDFTLYEDGIKQKIAFFATYDEPLNIALLLDTSGSTTSSLDKIKEAAKEFTDLLNPSDKCLVATFDARLNILNQFTSDHKALKKSLDEVQTAQLDGTVLRSAIEQVVKNSFNKIEGRNVMVILSDGKDFGSSITQAELANLLEESDVLIYTIFYKTGVGSDDLVISPDGTIKEADHKKKQKTPKPPKKTGYSIVIPAEIDLTSQEEIERREKVASIEAVDTFKELSEITAGRFYLSDTPNLKKVFKSIATELRQQYWLGYRSPDAVNSAKVHEIIVKVERADVVVRARGKFRAKQL